MRRMMRRSYYNRARRASEQEEKKKEKKEKFTQRAIDENKKKELQNLLEKEKLLSFSNQVDNESDTPRNDGTKQKYDWLKKKVILTEYLVSRGLRTLKMLYEMTVDFSDLPGKPVRQYFYINTEHFDKDYDKYRGKKIIGKNYKLDEKDAKTHWGEFAHRLKLPEEYYDKNRINNKYIVSDVICVGDCIPERIKELEDKNSTLNKLLENCQNNEEFVCKVKGILQGTENLEQTDISHDLSDLKDPKDPIEIGLKILNNDDLTETFKNDLIKLYKENNFETTGLRYLKDSPYELDTDFIGLFQSLNDLESFEKYLTPLNNTEQDIQKNGKEFLELINKNLKKLISEKYKDIDVSSSEAEPEEKPGDVADAVRVGMTVPKSGIFIQISNGIQGIQDEKIKIEKDFDTGNTKNINELNQEIKTALKNVWGCGGIPSKKVTELVFENNGPPLGETPFNEVALEKGKGIDGNYYFELKQKNCLETKLTLILDANEVINSIKNNDESANTFRGKFKELIKKNLFTTTGQLIFKHSTDSDDPSDEDFNNLFESLYNIENFREYLKTIPVNNTDIKFEDNSLKLFDLIRVKIVNLYSEIKRKTIGGTSRKRKSGTKRKRKSIKKKNKSRKSIKKKPKRSLRKSKRTLRKSKRRSKRKSLKKC